MAISGTLTRIVGLLLLVFLAFPVWAQEKGWETEWRKILAGARKEGKVVIRAPSDPVLRRELPKEFNRKFGVVLEYLVGRSSEVAAKLRLERRAGSTQWMSSLVVLVLFQVSSMPIRCSIH